MGLSSCSCCSAAHLILAGTSILRNFASKRGVEELKKCAAGGKGGSCRDVILRYKSEIVDYATSEPREASAELNAMGEALENGCRCIHKVIIYSSDTEAGLESSSILKEALERLCPSLSGRVEVKRVNRLGQPDAMWGGLKNLHSMMVNDIKSLLKEGYAVAVNLTGGFKPESGYALYASMNRAHVAYYVHESFRKPVYIILRGPVELKALAQAHSRCVKPDKRGCSFGLREAAAMVGGGSDMAEDLAKIACALESVDPGLIRVWMEEGECKVEIYNSNVYRDLVEIAYE